MQGLSGLQRVHGRDAGLSDGVDGGVEISVMTGGGEWLWLGENNE